MAQKIKVTRSITISHTADLRSYPGMTAEQAAEFERELTDGDAIEQIVTYLELDEPESFTVDVEIVDE